MEVKYPDITVELVGQDGNSYNICALVKRAMQRAGVPDAEVQEFLAEARGGDYDHLLVTCMRWVDCA